MKNKIGIIALISGIGLMIYFFLKSKKSLANQPLPDVYKDPPASSVADQIKNATMVNFNKLTQAEVSKYATWIDAIIDNLKTGKNTSLGTVNATVVNNSKTLAKIANPELIKVVNQWQKVRNLKIQDSLIFKSSTLDVTGSFPALVRKLKDIGFN